MKYERKDGKPTELKETFIEINGKRVSTINDILKDNSAYRSCVAAFGSLEEQKDADIKIASIWAASSMSLFIQNLKEDKEISRYALLYNALLFLRFVYQRNAGNELFDAENVLLVAEIDEALSKQVEKLFKEFDVENYEEFLEKEEPEGISVSMTDAIVRVISSNEKLDRFC